MNKTAVGILCGVTGGAAGLVIGFFLGKTKAEKAAEEKYNKHIEELREKYRKNGTIKEEDIDPDVLPDPESQSKEIFVEFAENDTPVPSVVDEVVRLFNEGAKPEEVAAKCKTSVGTVMSVARDYADQINVNVDELECDQEMTDIMEEVYANTDFPYMIHESEYGDVQTRDWTQRDLFYRGGNRIEDEEGNSVDIPTVVGTDVLDMFLRGHNDNIYVRNCSMRTDFEIVYDVQEDQDYLKVRNTGSNHGNFE